MSHSIPPTQRRCHCGLLLILALLTCALAPGCGSGGGTVLGPTLVDPSGDFQAGTGPVVSSADARLRVLSECLGIGGLTIGDMAAPIEVTGDNDPFDDVYEAPGGPFPVGTVVTLAGPKPTPYTCNTSYYIYWLDADRTQLPGHITTIVYVRESDGAMFKFTSQFAPVIDGVELFLYSDDKDARRVCSHQVMNQIHPPNQVAPIIDMALMDFHPKFGTGGTALEGANIGGLAVVGSPEVPLIHDILEAADLYKAMNEGSTDGFGYIRDEKDDHIDEDDLKDALAEASMGLGAGDKFFLYLSSHGSSDGEVKIGDDWITWTRLCELIEANVTATHVNLMFYTCYSGIAAIAFDGWKDKTEKGVRMLTSTDTTHPSYFDSDGSDATRCFVEKLKVLLAAAEADGELTKLEIEQAWKDVEVTKSDLQKKYCEQPSIIPLISLTAWAILKADFLLDGGLFDHNRGYGNPLKGGFSPGSGSGPNIEMEIGPSAGSGSTNDGAGQFDLELGAAYVFDFEGELRLRFQANLFRTDAPPPGSGYIDLLGDLSASPSDQELHFEVAGKMQVFPGAQVEDVTGMIIMRMSPDKVEFDIGGMHSSGQLLQFQSDGLLAGFGPGKPGDFDGDGDVDLLDRAFLSSCKGTAILPPACAAADLNFDGDVDLLDMQILQANFTGAK